MCIYGKSTCGLGVVLPASLKQFQGICGRGSHHGLEILEADAAIVIDVGFPQSSLHRVCHLRINVMICTKNTCYVHVST